MELTEEHIQKLKSLVRVAMTMNDSDNWENGEYFGDARKFWEGAEIGVDIWVEKMRKSQKPETSDEALHIANVVGRSEQLPCDCLKHPTYFDKEQKPRCKNCNERTWLAR